MVDESPRLETLTLEECLLLLRAGRVGRIATVVNDAPHIIPVNYQLVDTAERNWIALRSRPGGVLDQTPAKVAFEIDGADPTTRRGWSVLVRGTLLPVDPDAAEFRDRFDPQPWMAPERDAWLVIEPFAISGRRLHNADSDWPFAIDGHV